MTGDQNDGLADVYVDGNKVASLNMNSPVVGGTVLINRPGPGQHDPHG